MSVLDIVSVVLLEFVGIDGGVVSEQLLLPPSHVIVVYHTATLEESAQLETALMLEMAVLTLVVDEHAHARGERSLEQSFEVVERELLRVVFLAGVELLGDELRHLKHLH